MNLKWHGVLCRCSLASMLIIISIIHQLYWIWLIFFHGGGGCILYFNTYYFLKGSSLLFTYKLFIFLPYIFKFMSECFRQRIILILRIMIHTSNSSFFHLWAYFQRQRNGRGFHAYFVTIFVHFVVDKAWPGKR